MRYFTKDLYLNVPTDDPNDRWNEKGWAKAWEKYREQLEALRPRLSKKAWTFFYGATKHGVVLHDATLVSLVIGDAVDLSKEFNTRIKNKLHTTVTIQVLTYDQKRLYKLRYTGVFAVHFDFPSDQPFYDWKADRISDWLYDELTGVDENSLRHEILFASGSTLRIDFRHFSYSREWIQA